MHFGSNFYEWFAFWFDGAYDTNYIRLTPKTWNGVNWAVPKYVNVYYSAGGTWNFLRYVPLSADIAQTGYTISFPKVFTNGILLTTNDLRADPGGGYFFQIAEANGGLMDRFYAWSAAGSNVPSQSFAVNWSEDRQFLHCDFTATTADCDEADIIEAIENDSAKRGRLFIVGDEPDQPCTPPSVMAAEYHRFVTAVLSVDPTARFSPPGFAQPNDSEQCSDDDPYEDHSIGYAQQFLDELKQLNPVPHIHEWRFHAFGQTYSGCTAWSKTTWIDGAGWVNDMAAWSVANGAPMVLASFGFPGDTYNCDIVTPTGWMDEMLDTILNDHRIIAGVWFSYLTGPHALANKPYEKAMYLLYGSQ